MEVAIIPTIPIAAAAAWVGVSDSAAALSPRGLRNNVQFGGFHDWLQEAVNGFHPRIILSWHNSQTIERLKGALLMVGMLTGA